MNLPRAIYKPAGRAREYAELACNLFTGCPHGCVYCWAPAVLHRTRLEFAKNVRPRWGILEALDRDCRQLAKQGCEDEILLCFTCDPWPCLEPLQQTTLEAPKIIGSYMLTATTLSKGFPQVSGVWPIYERFGHRYGVSLSHTSEAMRDAWEPWARPPMVRLAWLEMAKEAGVETWVSVEPVFDVEEALRAIEEAAPWCDEFRLGKLNHMPEVEKTIDWRDYAERAVGLCQKLGKRYFVKKDLAAYLDPR